MPSFLSRRHLVLGSPLVMAASTSFSAQAATGSPSPIAAIETRHGGRLGVFALDTASGRTLAHRADERFLMCSTFKGLLAPLVLSRIDAGAENPDRLIAYGRNDLIFTSPVTEANVAKGALPVRTLLQAMVEQSDNTASILLMRETGGPEGLTRFLRGLGDQVTRSDRYEPDANQLKGEEDTTSPRAIVGNVQKILLGGVLRPASRKLLEDWMIATRPGLKRIRAALPEGWIAGHRPGTSVERETNDYAIVRPPSRAPLLVAAYYDAPGLDMAKREAVLREAGAAFVQWAREG